MLENTSVRQGLGAKIMSKENLFGDMSAKEVRRKLQEVSEYMDEVIDERRKQLRQRNLKRDDLPADPMWNLAHDVLEIIHCPEVDKPSSVGSLVIKIEVDTSELDEAIGKAERLAEMLNKNVHRNQSRKGDQRS
jgi:hypothetical protein